MAQAAESLEHRRRDVVSSSFRWVWGLRIEHRHANLPTPQWGRCMAWTSGHTRAECCTAHVRKMMPCKAGLRQDRAQRDLSGMVRGNLAWVNDASNTCDRTLAPCNLPIVFPYRLMLYPPGYAKRVCGAPFPLAHRLVRDEQRIESAQNKRFAANCLCASILDCSGSGKGEKDKQATLHISMRHNLRGIEQRIPPVE